MSSVVKRMGAAAIVAVSVVAAAPAMADVTIAADPRISEGAGSASVNPTNPKQIVSLVDKDGLKYLYRSGDAGATWAAVSALPFPASTMAYASNGRLYGAYSDDINQNCLSHILVAHSDDSGLTWSVPVDAFNIVNWFGFTAPKLATSADGWVYLTATADHCGGSTTGVGFARSPDGQTWAETVTLNQLLVYGNVDINPVGNGVPTAGNGGEVLVAISQLDDVWNCGGSTIKVLRSVDHGATFSVPVTAVASTPGTCDGVGSQNISVGLKGAAHLVYWRGEFSADEGNIEYTWSAPPYTTWAQPMPVSDDGLSRTQTNPHLATQTCGTTTVLHAVWEDNRLTPEGSPNRWNVFYSKKLAKNGAVWTKNVRLSSKPDIEQFSSVMSPAVVATTGKAFAVWDNNGDVFGKGIASCR